MAGRPPVKKPVRKIVTVSREEEEEEYTDSINTTAEADVHDEVCTTPPNGRAQSPDATQMSWILLPLLCVMTSTKLVVSEAFNLAI